jgi:hypothetical protein
MLPECADATISAAGANEAIIPTAKARDMHAIPQAIAAY